MMDLIYVALVIFVLFLVVPLIVCTFFKEKLQKKTIDRISFFNGLVLTVAFCGYAFVDSFADIFETGFNVFRILYFIGDLLMAWVFYSVFSNVGKKLMLSLCLKETEEGENDGIDKEN